MTNLYTIGIDPGSKGSFALLKGPDIVDVRPMPYAGGRVDPVDIAALYRDFRRLAGDPESIPVFVEKVQAMPHDGKVGMCSYWIGAGRLEMCAMWGWPIYQVPWGTWASVMHQGISKELPTKQRSEIAVKQLWPMEMNRFFASPRCKKIHDGMLEACLIAEYGRRRLCRS